MKYYIVSNEELEEYLWLMEHDESEDYEDDARGLIEVWSLVNNTKHELKLKDLVEIDEREYKYILNREEDEEVYLLDEREELLESHI